MTLRSGEWAGEGRPIVAAAARKGLLELELSPPAGAPDTSAPSEAALSCAAASDASSAAKVGVACQNVP